MDDEKIEADALTPWCDAALSSKTTCGRHRGHDGKHRAMVAAEFEFVTGPDGKVTLDISIDP